MITNGSYLLNALASVQVIQAMLAHARRTCTRQSFEDQAKGWLAERARLDEESRQYLQRQPPPAVSRSSGTKVVVRTASGSTDPGLGAAP
jgi:hypothetical protein